MRQPETAIIDPAIDPVEPTKKPKPQPKRMTMTSKSVERIPTPAKETIFWDESFRSFGVRVSPKGTRSWTCFVRIKPAMRGLKAVEAQLTLGRFPRVSLAEARDKARKAMASAEDGIDPRDKRVTPGGENSFYALVEYYLTHYVKVNCRESTYAQYERQLRLPRQRWGDLPAAAVTVQMIEDLVDEVAGRRLRKSKRGGGALREADNMLATLRACFRFGVKRRKLSADPTFGIDRRAKYEPRQRALSKPELVALWNACEKIGWPFEGVFKLVLLTGQRPGECAGMEWRELDTEQRLWTIPGSRTKNGKPSLVHISDQALDVIRAQPRTSPRFVFSTNGRTPVRDWYPASQLTAAHMAAASGGEVEHWTPHDLRRTFMTGLASMGVSESVADRVLNHINGSSADAIRRVYQTYAYMPERQAALALWGNHVDDLVHGRGARKVVSVVR